MSKENHSPLPWIHDAGWQYDLHSQETGELIIHCYDDENGHYAEDTAAFIKFVCGNHYQMLDHLKKLTCLLEQSNGTTKDGAVKEARDFLCSLGGK